TILNLGKCIHRSPTSEIVLYCLSFGVLLGQQSPLAAADIYEDDGIKYEKKSYLLRQLSMRIVPLIYFF
ncbi:hypothetical protein, partial [uncultured Duncaniella sp.]|uniref:hypothetical protein n=1 Tax=uncultured Duncaniella sp. TaxID=2768039 RepID=UPI0025B5DEC8